MKINSLLLLFKINSMKYLIISILSILGLSFTWRISYSEVGKACYYSNKLIGRKTSSGEVFSQENLTAAHKSLPFGTKVTVTNLENNQSVVVRINDRGPFVKGRIIDLSRAAANAIGIKGIQKVSLSIQEYSNKYKAKIISRIMARKNMERATMIRFL